MYNNQEKEFILDQVDRFCSYNIAIKQEKVLSEEIMNTFGGYRYVFEPNIFAVTSMNKSGTDENENGKEGIVKVTSNVNYAQAQYLANAIEKEKIDRAENVIKLKNEEIRIKNALSKNKRGNKNLNLSPTRPLSPNLSGASTPKHGATQGSRATRLADQMKLMAMESGTKKDVKGCGIGTQNLRLINFIHVFRVNRN